MIHGDSSILQVDRTSGGISGLEKENIREIERFVIALDTKGLMPEGKPDISSIGLHLVWSTFSLVRTPNIVAISED